MKNPNTLASSLDAHDKAMHTVTYQQMMMGAPGDTMNHSDVRENTDFGKLLHKEGLWSLYTYDGLSQSLLYHLCRGYLGMELINSPVRPRTGECTACNSKAPDEIRGLWTLHNFDWIQQNGGNTFYGDMGI